MSEDFKNLDAAQVVSEVDRLDFILTLNQHNPAQLTGRRDNVIADIRANRLAASPTVTDSAQATITALITFLALSPGNFFEVQGTGDTTDNGLQAAKGSAPAANDLFYVVSASAVEYVA